MHMTICDSEVTETHYVNPVAGIKEIVKRHVHRSRRHIVMPAVYEYKTHKKQSC